ncbi:hypothetical protein T492DRAFT_559140, partial [Pavlovales sp. CCMP2436]
PALAPEFTRIHGLYPRCDWDPKRVAKLIQDGKLAPCVKGREDGGEECDDECPICMFTYPVMNRTGCCAKAICT